MKIGGTVKFEIYRLEDGTGWGVKWNINKTKKISRFTYSRYGRIAYYEARKFVKALKVGTLIKECKGK